MPAESLLHLSSLLQSRATPNEVAMDPHRTAATLPLERDWHRLSGRLRLRRRQTDPALQAYRLRPCSRWRRESRVRPVAAQHHPGEYAIGTEFRSLSIGNVSGAVCLR